MKYQEIPTKQSGIYKINYPNNKIYIGRAKDIKKRIWEHYTKIDNTPCQNALWFYFKSCNDIDIDILEVLFPYDLNKICLLEKKWIQYYHSNDRKIGYNLTSGGDGAASGIENVASKFSEEDLNNIIVLLKQGKSNVYISSIYNVHPDTIGKINQGKTYYNENLDYPLRKELSFDYGEKYNCLNEEQLNLALFLLSTTNLSREKISEQTEISITVLSQLNVGKHPYCKLVNIDFPIRKTRRTCRLTDEEIRQIKKELLNKNYSIQDIAAHFNCSRDTISDINQGKRYKKEGELYPIRNFYPNRGSKKPVSTISGSGE